MRAPSGRLLYHLAVLALLSLLLGSGCGGGGSLAENGVPEGSEHSPGSVAVTINRSAFQTREPSPTPSPTPSLEAVRVVIAAQDPVTRADLVTPLNVPIPTDATSITVTLQGVRVGPTLIVVNVFAAGDILVATTFTTVNVQEGNNSAVTMRPESVLPIPTPSPSPTPFVPFLFVTNKVDNTVMSFENPSGGVPTLRDTQPTGAAPVAIAIAGVPGQRYLFTANFGDASISGFRVDEVGGRLSHLGTTSVPGADTPVSLSVGFNNFTLYVAAGSNHVYGFEINPTTGALTQLAGTPKTLPGQPTSVLALERSLFVTNGSRIMQFDIVAGGLLSGGNSTNTINTLTRLTGRPPTPTLPSLLYGLDTLNTLSSVEGFTVTSVGALLNVPTNPTPDGSLGSNIAINPRQDFLYTTNVAGNVIRCYQIAPPTGGIALTSTDNTSVSSPTGIFIPGTLALYVTNATANPATNNGYIGIYSLNSAGATSFVTSVNTGKGPSAITGF